jgi:hypothetical protein
VSAEHSVSVWLKYRLIDVENRSATRSAWRWESDSATFTGSSDLILFPFLFLKAKQIIGEALAKQQVANLSDNHAPQQANQR